MSFRPNPQVREKLRSLCERMKLTQTELVELLIETAHHEISGGGPGFRSSLQRQLEEKLERLNVAESTVPPPDDEKREAASPSVEHHSSSLRVA